MFRQLISPTAIAVRSPDHVRRLCEHRLGNREAKALRGSQVDDELERSWHPDREICRAGALQYLVDVARSPP